MAFSKSLQVVTGNLEDLADTILDLQMKFNMVLGRYNP